MANRQTVDALLIALETRLVQGRAPLPDSLALSRFEQELEEVVQLADRTDAAYFRDRIDLILSRRH